MRVKRLDLFGFKSFAVKTAVHFEPGVTAIVGPNGSGKSNIVDSIRWVLGEHNPRDVRAPRLEDVIFNGTDTKAPLSMAEVSLLIDNERGLLPIAFSEILVTRRVYRSGESEYLINQSPCRLKDIQELFLGTGLGGGTYAIIEQGHIDLILSSKPEERRGVFEEASGVAKYLSKKQETMRRLDEVEQHLTRIADIITEVRRQLNALERQAARARQYKTQWEQLKQWELRLAAHELRQGDTADQELRQSVESLSRKRETLDASKQQLLGSLEACNAAVTHTQATLQDVRTRLVETTSRIDQHTNQTDLKRRWIEELTQQRQQVEQDVTQLSERLTRLARQLEYLNGQHAALQQQQQEMAAQQAQAQQEHAQLGQVITEHLQVFEQFKAELFDAAAAASQHRNALASTLSRLQQAAAQVTRIEDQQTAARTRAEAVTQRQQQVESERRAIADEHARVQTQLLDARRGLDDAQGRRHELMGRLNALRERTVSQRARVQLLEDVWRRHEGFSEAVKHVLTNPPEGVVGLLADLLEPVAGYEHALEAALGTLASAIVVTDRQALRRCQAFLHTQELDWAQFIVLSDGQSAAAPSSTPSQEGVAGPLTRWVRCDASLERFVHGLLQLWWVVDRLDRVGEIAASDQRRWVTPQGEWWDGVSWQLVGTRRAESIRVGRKHRWEQASEELAALERDLATLQTAWEQSEEQWRSLSAQEQRIREHVEGLLPALSKSDAQSAQLQHEAKRLQEELSTLELDHQEFLTQRQELAAAEQAQQHTVAEAEARQHALEAQRQSAQVRHDEAQQRTQQLNVLLAQFASSLESVSERQAGIATRLEELRTEHTHTQTQHQQKQIRAQELGQKTGELTAQLDEHRQQIEQLQQQQLQLQAQVDQVAQQLQEEDAKRNQVLPQVLAAEQELALLLQQLQQQETQLTERSFRRSRIIERLHEVYHIEEAAILAEEIQLTPLAEEERLSLTEQVDRLKAKLEAMGPVSLGSVDEYDELKQRLEFLQTQQQDLIKSREDLKQSITQINRTARHQFRETFAKIQTEFKHYYTKLFGGGEADLILLDEEDVLESGIEIVARPPGKRLQSISLLSGGERALTAIALLFALFKVRPSPFCILDEIDAPLDEANVDRFTRVFEEFLSLSQFILVTHNKKTITKADCLYGVTMEQPGISKIVSVKLTTKKPAAATPSAEPAPAPVESSEAQAGAVAA